MPELAPEGPSCAGGLTCAGRSCCESVRIAGGLLHLGANCDATCDPDSIRPVDGDYTPEIDLQVPAFALGSEQA